MTALEVILLAIVVVIGMICGTAIALLRMALSERPLNEEEEE